MKKLVWNNYMVYNPNTIAQRMNFVKQYINYFFPMNESEKIILDNYAKKINISPHQLYSFGNMLRIQNDLNNSVSYKKKKESIKSAFSKEISNNHKNHDESIKNFIESTKIPANIVLKIIKNTPIYKEEDFDESDYIKNLKKSYYDHNKDVLNRSKKFEVCLENYLRNLGVDFKTETDIIRKKLHKFTPDILLNKPIIIELNGKEYPISWIDAKNYTLIRMPFVLESLRKQSNKYNKAFGNGAFVFHYGLDSSINIPNTLILDGSKISNADNNYCL
ncbi:hypothetical protein lvs_L466 [Acanthamoeba polyphaga lentillevirus]|nr:hypothetical protein lvs_L466 [Acanthamoeba polyphaga lentillevirus]